jgi:predicted protein tyrosine phosphatase
MLEYDFASPEEHAAYADFQLAVMDAHGSTDGTDYYSKKDGTAILEAAYERAMRVHGIGRSMAIAMLITAEMETEPTIRELAALTPEDFNEQAKS